MPPIDFADLILTAAKQLGKNNSKYDGFYKLIPHPGLDNPAHDKFFIKVPADRRERFVELFMGRIFEKFKELHVIPPVDHESFICADLIKCPDNELGLIQDQVEFTVLFKEINTKAFLSGDRSVFYEMLAGPWAYQSLAKEGIPPGLAIAVMLNIVLGNNSVHSGNIVILKNKRMAIIDYGAGLRDLGHEDNQDLENPRECQGIFNYRKYTKNYLKNYRKIPGFYAEIAKHAKQTLSLIESKQFDLVKIICDILNKIPSELLDAAQAQRLSKYTSLPCDGILRSAEANQKFAVRLSELILSRLHKAMNLEPSVEIQEVETKHSVAQESVEKTYITQFLAAKDFEQEEFDTLHNPEKVEALEKHFSNQTISHSEDSLHRYKRLVNNASILSMLDENCLAINDLDNFEEVCLLQQETAKAVAQLPKIYQEYKVIIAQMKYINLYHAALVKLKEAFALQLQQLKMSTSFEELDNNFNQINAEFRTLPVPIIELFKSELAKVTVDYEDIAAEKKLIDEFSNACQTKSFVEIEEAYRQLTVKPTSVFYKNTRERIASDFARFQNCHQKLSNLNQPATFQKLSEYNGEGSNNLFEAMPKCLSDLKQHIDQRYQYYAQRLPQASWFDALEIANLNHEHFVKFVENPELLNLITVLDNFKQKYSAAKFAGKYTESVTSFYEAAKAIALDPNNKVNIINQIKQEASLHFKHRHPWLLADFLCVITGIFILYGPYRLLTGRTFFCSNSATYREQEILLQLDSLPNGYQAGE